MARPREFDEDAALAAATRCFWSRGYEATSVRDLARHMGITGASLYNAFGDKRALFRRVLDHYVAGTLGDRIARFEPGLPPRAAIGAFFDEVVRLSVNDPDRKGCLLINSALEVAPHDREFAQVISGVLGQLEGFFQRCVAAGQRDGSITDAQPADDLARLLLATLMSLRIMARTRPEPAMLEGLVRPALALLDSPRVSPAVA